MLISIEFKLHSLAGDPPDCILPVLPASIQTTRLPGQQLHVKIFSCHSEIKSCILYY